MPVAERALRAPAPAVSSAAACSEHESEEGPKLERGVQIYTAEDEPDAMTLRVGCGMFSGEMVRMVASTSWATQLETPAAPSRSARALKNVTNQEIAGLQ